MTLNVKLNPELETRLRAFARRSGKEPASIVVEALAERLAQSDVGIAAADAEWRKAFDRFLLEFRADSTYVDDSRDTIYEGRGL